MSGPKLSMWPVRPKIQEDESLTSWLTRTANEYDYKPYMLCQIALDKKIRPNLDFDIKIKSDDLKKLSRLSGQPYNKLKDATFLDEYFKWDRSTKLWLDCRINRPPRNARVVFCPKCITDPKQHTPYLRKEWRISYNVICKYHRIRLIEKCPICYTPFNLNSPFLLQKKLQVCHNCDQPIRKMAIQISDQTRLDQMLINSKAISSSLINYLNNAVFEELKKQREKSSNPKVLELINPKLQSLWDCRTTPLGEMDIGLRYELMRLTMPIYKNVINRSYDYIANLGINILK
ncbi:hypothetical protein D0S45_10295 [Marinifilum sp. JC120]|nr:hypothetical protein D0S45_10295 [Marinifilum sp. JC120]